MCTIEKDGYRMNDGTLVRFATDARNIPVKYINELNENTPSAWDSFQIHSKLSDIQEKILNSLNARGQACPLNKDGIIKVVDEQLLQSKDSKVKKYRDVGRDILMFLMIVSLIFTMVSVFGSS